MNNLFDFAAIGEYLSSTYQNNSQLKFKVAFRTHIGISL